MCFQHAIPRHQPESKQTTLTWLYFFTTNCSDCTANLFEMLCRKNENGVWGEVTDEFCIGFP